MTSGERSRRKRRRRRLSHGDPGISIWSVADRDRCKCHLCGGKVDMTLAASNTDWAPSVDHLVALGDGGSNTWDNVALAHRFCNTERDHVPLSIARSVLPYRAATHKMVTG